MKILAISDTESKYLWDDFSKEKLSKIDLILSCGDLSPLYLSFLATFFKGPVLYVHGNHDAVYEVSPPYGCICVEDQIYVHEGIRILGLGGSIRYNRSGPPYQYTQAEMRRRVRKLWLSLQRRGGFDILLTHSAAFGLGDGEDQAHVGFMAFRELLDRWTPPLFVHGHTHLNYDTGYKRLYFYGQTQIVNAYGRYAFEL